MQFTRLHLASGVLMTQKDFTLRLLFLCVSHTLLHVYTNLPLALLPILIKEYELSIFLASIAISIPRGLSLIFLVPSGLLADRLGHTKLISLSLLLEAIAALLIVMFSTLETVVLCFSLTALASTLYHPSALSATTNILPTDFVNRGLGFHGGSGTLGIALGPITLGLVLNLLGWRYAYLIWIAPILAIAVTALFVEMDESLPAEHDERKKNLITPLKDVMSVTFLSFLLLVLFISAAGGTISTYLTTYLTESKGLDTSLASIIFGLGPMLGLISVIIGGYFGDKIGWKRALTVIISTVIGSLFLMFVSTSPVQTVLFFFSYGFFNIMTMPITTSLVARIIPKKSRGTAFSLQFIPESIIGVVMPVMLGILISFVEIWIIFPIAMAFNIIALVITQVLDRNMRTRNRCTDNQI